MWFECLPCVRGNRFGTPLNIKLFYTWLLKQVVKMVYCIRKEICLKNEEAIKDELAGVCLRIFVNTGDAYKTYSL